MQRFGLVAHSGLLHVQFSPPNRHELNCSVCRSCAAQIQAQPALISQALTHIGPSARVKAAHAHTYIATLTYYGLSTGKRHLPFELRGPSPVGCLQLLTVAHSLCSQMVQIYIRVTQETHLHEISGHSGVKISLFLFPNLWLLLFSCT